MKQTRTEAICLVTQQVADLGTESQTLLSPEFYGSDKDGRLNGLLDKSKPEDFCIKEDY